MIIKLIIEIQTKNKDDVKVKGMYNPMEKILTNEGIGSNSYRDVWFLFDQVIISKGLLGNDFSINSILILLSSYNGL